MATMTAQILIGHSHRFHGGISPRHFLFLTENDRPAMILVRENITGSGSAERVVWIPTVERMLEDALLMIAVHVLETPVLAGPASSREQALELYSFTDNARHEYYRKCRQVDFRAQGCEIVLLVLPGSTFEGQLPVLATYQVDVQLCRVAS